MHEKIKINSRVQSKASEFAKYELFLENCESNLPMAWKIQNRLLILYIWFTLYLLTILFHFHITMLYMFSLVIYSFQWNNAVNSFKMQPSVEQIIARKQKTIFTLTPFTRGIQYPCRSLIWAQIKHNLILLSSNKDEKIKPRLIEDIAI